MMRVVPVLLCRVWRPLIFFRGFSLMCARLPPPRRLALAGRAFWIINPHAIEYRRVRDTTKLFSSTRAVS
jgi:hypothetical protein